MGEHLSQSEIQAYRGRSIPAEQLLAVDDHLAECRNCRENVAIGLNPVGLVSFLKGSLRVPHLDYESLVAHAEGRLRDEAAREHLAECAQCRVEAEDLRTFVVQQAGKRVNQGWIGRLRSVSAWRYGLSAAALAGAVWMAVPLTAPVAPRATTTWVDAPAVVPETDVLPTEYAVAVDRALAVGKIEVPAALGLLGGPKGTLLGQGANRQQFRLTAPLRTFTVSTMPEFRWTPLPGARAYRVSVFDAGFHPVASSGAVQGTTWRPEIALRAGVTYSWQVTAEIAGRAVIAPQPPDPEAKFQVMARAEARKLDALRSEHPHAHLALGVLFAQAGAVNDAANELRVAATGADAVAARKLLASLDEDRPGTR